MIKPLTPLQRDERMKNAIATSLRSRAKRPKAENICRICQAQVENNQQACQTCNEELEKAFVASYGLHNKILGGF